VLNFDMIARSGWGSLHRIACAFIGLASIRSWAGNGTIRRRRGRAAAAVQTAGRGGVAESVRMGQPDAARPALAALNIRQE
jgi:hypothetical protein